MALYWPSPPDVTPGFEVPGLDKAVHFGLFALATWALLRVLPVWAAVGLMLVQVGLSEWVQGTFLPQRSADVWDAVADLVGIAAGWAGWTGWTRWGRSGHGGVRPGGPR